MAQLLLEEIVKAAGGEILYGNQRAFTGLSIDSRTIKQDELFIAIRGERFDGHDFLSDALKTGAGAVVERPPAVSFAGRAVIVVKDTLTALQDIARNLRRTKDVTVVGVTGTNGKTTTKELIASVLGIRHRVLKTDGNLNNHIGLPLSICRMKGDESVMVLEMGSNAEGDIALLCDIARPDFAVVTNVGAAHLEGFGSLETVRRTDLEILAYAKTVSVNADDAFLCEGLKRFDGKVVTYGIKSRADVRAEDIELSEKGSRFVIRFPDGGGLRIDLRISGEFNIRNALAAASLADALGTGRRDIKEGLESFGGVPMRLEVKELAGAVLINDVYNANPASMEEAVRELMRLKRKRTVAVLGDMLELGRYTESAHKELVDLLSFSGVDVLIAVGNEMKRASSGFMGTCHRADDATAAGSILSEVMLPGDTVLIKGSRGMRMERVSAGVRVRGEGEKTNAL
jgi:UDP-N-acetylmuramoyl-tripeptide--D-alanyl-D-alanine ligase